LINPVEIIAQLGELGTAGLLIALIILFVAAFKILEMVMQTVLVSVLSGGFYFALAYYVDSLTFSLNSLLFFAFIGGSLYTGYHLLIQGYSIVSTVLNLLYGTLRFLIKIPKTLIQRLKETDIKKEVEES